MPWLSLEATKSIKIVKNSLERLRRKIPLVSRLRIYRTMVNIRKAMKQPGSKPTYPIQWDSTKQRKAYFASNGFGGGIPTRRGREYLKAWKVVRTQKGYDVGNPLAHAKYIGGTPRSGRTQSKIHRGRWPLFVDAINKFIGKLPKAVRDGIKTIARHEGFRTSE